MPTPHSYEQVQHITGNGRQMPDSY